MGYALPATLMLYDVSAPYTVRVSVPSVILVIAQLLLISTDVEESLLIHE